MRVLHVLNGLRKPGNLRQEQSLSLSGHRWLKICHVSANERTKVYRGRGGVGGAGRLGVDFWSPRVSNAVLWPKHRCFDA